jgi:hypothetical protein
MDYAFTLNNLRRIPRSIFGDFQTTIFIVIPPLRHLPPAAGVTAANQQEGHQKHQEPYRENSCDQNSRTQSHRADSKKPPRPFASTAATTATAIAAISSAHCHASFPSGSVYTGESVPGAGFSQKKTAPSEGGRVYFFSCQSFSGFSSS